jgi:hypothetical protein
MTPVLFSSFLFSFSSFPPSLPNGVWGIAPERTWGLGRLYLDEPPHHLPELYFLDVWRSSSKGWLDQGRGM